MKNTIFFATIILLLTGLLTLIWYDLQKAEVSPQHYQQINSFVSEFPQLKPVVDKAASDGVIERSEYREIKNQYGTLYKQKVFNKFHWK